MSQECFWLCVLETPEYDVLMVKGFIFIHDAESVGGSLLALVQWLSSVSMMSLILLKCPSLAREASCCPATLSAGRRRKKPFPDTLCHVDTPSRERTWGRGRSRAAPFSRQRLPRHASLLTSLCHAVSGEELFMLLYFKHTKKCWKRRGWCEYEISCDIP